MTRFETEAQENSDVASTLKSIFEKLCFRDGLILKKDLTRRRIKAAI